MDFKSIFVTETRQKLNELVSTRIKYDRDDLQMLLRIIEGSVFLRAVVFDNFYRGIFNEAIWENVDDSCKVTDIEKRNGSKRCRAIFNTMSALSDFSASNGITTMLTCMDGGKEVKTSILCYAYAYAYLLSWMQTSRSIKTSLQNVIG